MKHNTRGRQFVILLTLAVLLLGVFSAANAQDGNVLRVGMEVPVVLDPAMGTNDPETALNRAVYDYLIEVKPDSSIAPNLASDWTVSDDGLTYTFNLVEGITFHDGSPFTAADVIYTYNRLVELGSPATRLIGEFTMEAPDDTTIVFTIPEPNADFLYGIGSRWALIVKDGTEDPTADFNGTGPFILDSLDANAGGRAVFSANPNYWKAGQPAISGMEHIYFAGDAVTQLDAASSGEVDLVYKIPVSLVSDGVADGLSVIEQQTSQHPVIRLRADEGPGMDVNVRQAFKYATNREELNDILLDGLGTVGHNDPISPAYSIYYDDMLEDQPYDPEMACQLLSDAGYPDGLEMTLYAPIAFEYPDLAVLLQNQWAAGCINVDVQTFEAGQYYDTTNEINYCDVELGITGWGARPVPQLFFIEAYVTNAIDEGCLNGFNESHFSDPELDDLVQQASVTADDAERAAIYAQISQIFKERGPIIVPYFAPMIGVVSDSVQGLELAPFPGLTDYRTVTMAE
ncbi:MAG: ABC transporter substrate-binding protein [Anaerolineae bacterium]|nr:ABC transporter substrate-binding protein [Anaerolineae bacterium]